MLQITDVRNTTETGKESKTKFNKIRGSRSDKEERIKKYVWATLYPAKKIHKKNTTYRNHNTVDPIINVVICLLKPRKY
jgi:hypothetical protein